MLKLFVILNLICELRNAILNAKILSQVLGQSLRRVFFIDEIFDNLKINPGSIDIHTSEIYLQLRAAFHHSFFYL